MSLLERVQKLLEEKGITVRQAERDSGLSNATIRKWETQKPSLDSLIKLASYLQVSIDYLVTGEKGHSSESRFEIYCDGVPLTESEADLVAMYRLLPVDHREEVFDIVHRKYTRLVAGGEKASIYSTYEDTKEQSKNSADHGDETKSGIA